MWSDHAACKSSDPSVFFPESPKDAYRAQIICSGCVVRTACLEYALEAGEAYGVWGGVLFGGKSASRRLFRLLSQFDHV